MTDFAISNLPAPAGSLQYAELFAPGGGLIAAEMPLVESPAGIFGGTVAIDPGSVDNLTTPYEYEVRQVLTPDPAGFDASATITVSRGTYGYLSGGVGILDDTGRRRANLRRHQHGQDADLTTPAREPLRCGSRPWRRRRLDRPPVPRQRLSARPPAGSRRPASTTRQSSPWPAPSSACSSTRPAAGRTPAA
jgi:hypothetical protein